MIDSNSRARAALAVLFFSCFLFALSGCLSYPTLVSDVVRGFRYDEGPWIVYGDNPETDVVISWTSSVDDEPIDLLIGTTPNNLIKVDVERHGHIRRARVAGLKKGTEYFYRTTGSSEVASFTTPGDASGFRFAVFGDMQSTTPVSEAGNRVMSEALGRIDVDLYVQLGDLAENGGNLNDWRSVLDYFGEFADSTPVAPLPGNHDWIGDPDLSNFRALFPVDFAGDRGGYYSFDVNGVHFLMLDGFDTALGSRMSSVQREWAEQDLRTSYERGDRWTFIFLHYALLTTGASSAVAGLREWLIPLADKYGADAVFFGHDHHYEHWQYEYGWNGMVYHDDDEPSGREIHYFGAGGGGARPEMEYGLLTRLPLLHLQRWYNLNTGTWTSKVYTRKKWNRTLFLDHTGDPYGRPAYPKHYYHAPEVQAYSNDVDQFGYDYGEQTLHYVIVDISDESPDVCTISVNYPSGELLTGPGSRYPQRWELRRK